MRWLVKLIRKKSKMQNQLLGEVLKSARSEAGLTQTEAGAWLARDQPFITRIESGSQQATFVEVEQLARVYGKQLADFQTLKVIEERNRSFAACAEKINEYTELLLHKQSRRRKRKRRAPIKPRR